MIRPIVGLILFGVICVAIGYAVGVYDMDRDAIEVAYNALQDYCDMLEKDNKRFLEFVPKTERKKELIIMMHNLGKSDAEIGRALDTDTSTICKALQRRGIKQHKNNINNGVK